jgi:hypothetical protein
MKVRSEYKDIRVRSVPASVGGSMRLLSSNLDLVIREKTRTDVRAGHPRIK